MSTDLPDIPKEFWPEPEELPGDLARLAELVDQAVPGRGVEVTLRIARAFRGTYIYCHNIDALLRKPRDRWIREQYARGARVPDIARKVGLGERRGWDILGSAGKSGKVKDDRQMGLF